MTYHSKIKRRRRARKTLRIFVAAVCVLFLAVTVVAVSFRILERSAYARQINTAESDNGGG